MVLKVKDLLDKYFDGKKDKGGHPYIWHLDSVALAVEKEKERSRYASWNINDEAHFVDYDRAIVVAYLHDILEDTDCTIDELLCEPGTTSNTSAIKCPHCGKELKIKIE